MGIRRRRNRSRPKPTITDPSDAIIQVTHCTISGSDLHLYEGDLDDIMRKGDIMGREAIGLVDEVGLKVRSRKVGDRVIIIPVIVCGNCEYCQRKEYSLCDVAIHLKRGKLCPDTVCRVCWVIVSSVRDIQEIRPSSVEYLMPT